MSTPSTPSIRRAPTGTEWERIRQWKTPGGFVVVVIRSTAGATRTVSLFEWDTWGHVS